MNVVREVSLRLGHVLVVAVGAVLGIAVLLVAVIAEAVLVLHPNWGREQV